MMIMTMYFGRKCMGVARGCSGCRCTPKARKMGGAEFMGRGVICKCTPTARMQPLRIIFYWAEAGAMFNLGGLFHKVRRLTLTTKKRKKVVSTRGNN